MAAIILNRLMAVYFNNYMNKKARLALLIAIAIPLVSYFIVKILGESAVVMPKRYYVDTVITTVENGKTSTDTIWHQVGNIKLKNQLDDFVSLDSLKGKIIVADFFFTRCPTICPTLTKNMQKLQASFASYKDGRRVVDSSIVQFISFTVDPERDSSKALKKYADKFNVNHDSWWMLTGNKKSIYDFALNELKLGLVDGEGVDSNFIHTQKFVLLDKDLVVRGYYNGLETESLKQLATDIGLLMLEKDRKKKRKLF